MFKFMDFLYGIVPHKTKQSKELISHDTKNNTYNYKYTFYFEIPKICGDDIVILPKKFAKIYGGVNSLCICYKVSSLLIFTSSIHVSLKRLPFSEFQKEDPQDEAEQFFLKKN